MQPIAVRAIERRSIYGKVLTFIAVPKNAGFRIATNAKLFAALLKPLHYPPILSVHNRILHEGDEALLQRRKARVKCA